jgi:uncharacterized protein
VLTEAAWLLRKPHGTLDRITEAHAAGVFDLLPLESADLAEIATIMLRFSDSGVEMANAAVAWLAEREGIRAVFTHDRQDLSIIRLKSNQTLTLLPDSQ